MLLEMNKDRIARMQRELSKLQKVVQTAKDIEFTEEAEDRQREARIEKEEIAKKENEEKQKRVKENDEGKVSYDRLSVSADKGVHGGEVVECLLDEN